MYREKKIRKAIFFSDPFTHARLQVKLYAGPHVQDQQEYTCADVHVACGVVGLQHVRKAGLQIASLDIADVEVAL